MSLARRAIKTIDNTSRFAPSFYLICWFNCLIKFATSWQQMIYNVVFQIASNQNQSNLFPIPVTPKQIERLYSRFTSLDRSDCGTLSREDFLRIPELAINPLCDRIVHSFISDSTDDRVNFRQFMQVLARFRTIKSGKDNKLNNREEKMRCEYQQNLNHDKIVQILRNVLFF